MNNKINPLLFFVQNTKYKLDQIVSCEKVIEGLSNETFHVITNDKCEYQLRFGSNNDIIFRDNEIEILETINNHDYLYYDKNNGNSIRKWIFGKNPKHFDYSHFFLDLLVKEIQKIHQINIKKLKNVRKHDNLVFASLVQDKIDLAYWSKYIELNKKYQNMEQVLSHNDLSPSNIIWDSKNQKLTIIDYEWGRVNNRYWDYANFIRETELNIELCHYLAKIANLDWPILVDFIFMSICFAIQWTYSMPQNSRIIKYRFKTNKIMTNYYPTLHKK